MTRAMAADADVAPLDDASADPRGEQTIRLSFRNGGFNVAPVVGGRDNTAFWRRMESGEWEPETQWLLERIIGPGVEFYDVGAWIGPTALFAAMKGARVVAFEPDPIAWEALSATLALNPELGEVAVRRYALAAAPALATLFSGDLGNSESSLLAATQRREGVISLPARAQIECRSFAQELASISPDAVVKIDVEGAEFDIFDGGSPPPPAAVYLISTHAPNLVAEGHEESRRLRARKVNAFLDAFSDYHWHRLSRWGLLPLDQALYRTHCTRHSDRWDELVFSRAPLPFSAPKQRVDAAVLWASNHDYQPWRAMGGAMMGLRGFKRVSSPRAG